MRRPKRVGIIGADADWFSREVLRGAAVVFAQCRWDARLFASDHLTRDFDPDELDGLIGRLDLLKEAGVRLPASLATVNTPCDDPAPGGAAVGTDQAAVGRCAADYLLSLGIPNFGYFGSCGGHAGACHRAFVGRLAGAGCSCSVLDRLVGGRRPAPPERAGRLRRWVAYLAKPAAVLAESDELGLSLLQACGELGVAVPQALAMLAVGNDELVCGMTVPALSSIALPAEQVGHDAARMLAGLMGPEPAPARQLLLAPLRVVLRGSSGFEARADVDVAAAMRFIRLHVRDDVSVSDIVRELSISRRSLELKFERELGCAPAAQIRRARIDAAKLLLAGTRRPIPSIALASGFRGARHLLGVFSRDVQMTPSAYRRSTPSLHARSPA